MKFKIEYGAYRRQGFKVWNETRKVLHYTVVIHHSDAMEIFNPAGDRLAVFGILSGSYRYPQPNYEMFTLTLMDGPRRYVIQCKDHDNHNWVIRSEEDIYETLRYADKITCIFQDGVCIGKIGYEKNQWIYRYIDFEMLDNYNPVLLLGTLLYFFQPAIDDSL
jgi:hypothetical protein